MSNRGAQKLKRFRKAGHERFTWTRPLSRSRPIPHHAIAAELRCHTTMVQKLEAGERIPSLDLATRLDKLGIAEPSDWMAPADEEVGAPA